MSTHRAYVVDAATGQPIEADLHDDLRVDVLLDIEDQWAAARQQLRADLRRLNVPLDQWPQSLHWDWGAKGVSLSLSRPDDFRIMAVRQGTQWQGAMVTRSQGHRAVRPPDAGQPLIYVDFLEVAPWNWTIEHLQRRRQKAVGAALLLAAVEQSYAKGWDGRMGLHALPQATDFYTGQGLQFVANDARKQNLPYFELTAAEASSQTGRR